MTTLPDKRSCPFDPPDEYRTLREQEPISPLDFVLSPGSRNGWLVTTLAEVRAILADPRFSHRQELVALPIPPPFPFDVYQPEPAAPGTFNKMDAPEHTRYRRLLAKHFTVRRIRSLEPAAERIAAELLDGMVAAGPTAELVADYAEPLATRLMCELVGVPETDRAELLHHLTVVARLHYTLDELIAAITTISANLDRLVTDTDPVGNGLLSELVRTGELTHDELVNLTWALVGGGFDTTTNMLALGTFALLRHPDQLRRLLAEPALWDNGIEELLRYLTVSHLGASRCALTDVQVGEHTIAAGETVVLALSAANRDPARFPEPDVLDVGRVTQGHVAFGHGVHQCIGQHLARLTMRVGFRALFDRCTDLRLAVSDEEIMMRADMLHYGVHELPVTWV
jgi:cytochrome P450